MQCLGFNAEHNDNDINSFCDRVSEMFNISCVDVGKMINFYNDEPKFDGIDFESLLE